MIDQVISALAANEREAKSTFGGLSSAQLNWKPSAEKWSVGQVIEHLIAMNSPFLPIFNAVANGTYRPSLAAKLPFWGKFIGKLLIKSVAPEEPRKVKTGNRFEPKSSAVNVHILAEFSRNHRELTDDIGRLRSVDLEKTLITSPVSPIAAYSLADAFQIITLHEQRHFAQARRVMAEDGFPKA